MKRWFLRIFRRFNELSTDSSKEFPKKVIDLEQFDDVFIITNKKVYKAWVMKRTSRLLQIFIWESKKEVIINTIGQANSSVIPSNFEIQIDVDVNVLYEMIDRASLLTSDKDKNTIKLMLNKNELVILSNSPEIGKVEEKLSLVTDKEIDISFSSKYMMEALRSFEAETVTICMNNDISPIVIKSTDDNNLVQLLLPIKTY